MTEAASFSVIERHCCRKPRPPAGFRPLEPGTSVEQYGLPRRPDERGNPVAFGLWCRMLSAPLMIREPRLSLASVNDPAGGQPHSPSTLPDLPCGTRKGLPRTRSTTCEAGWSENWSGAYITPHDAERFTQIWGSWTVPRPCLPQGGGSGSTAADHRCSIWIGMGGHREHARSLPQLGTAQAVSEKEGGPAVACWAWFQWWVGRGREIGPVNLAPKDFPVQPDEEIICCLAVELADVVAFHFKNQTNGRYRSIHFSAAEPGAQADGASAEWIVERPSLFPPPSEPQNAPLHPLPDYGSVTFHGCAAETRPAPGQGRGTPRGLVGARLIGMSEARSDPYRSVLISRPEKVDDATLRVVYRG